MQVFPSANYVLFDALPAHAAPLTAFAARHQNAQVRSVALGDAPGTLTLHVHGHQSSILSSAEFSGTSVDVQVHTLDDFVDELQLEGPILLKADVQGYELAILRGAERVLAMTDLALLEVSFQPVYDNAPMAHELITEMGALGFRIFDICSHDQRPLDGALAQSDVVFARPTSGLFQQQGWG